MSIFAGITTLPPDALFDLKERCNNDTNPNKVDLGIGAYRDENGKPWILPSVREGEKKLQTLSSYNHEYLSISGHGPFTTAARKVIIGDYSGHVISQQSLSGTGALHVVGLFLKSFLKTPGASNLYLSSPTWGNHKQIFEDIGFDVKSYPYWNQDKSLNINGFLDSIKNADSGSIFLLHACAHNPTGLDPSTDQWKQIIDLINKKKHIIIFDSAYQGFASGNLLKDRIAIDYALKNKSDTPIIICQSFAKNMGMYGERVGAIHIVYDDHIAAITSQLKKIIRSEISNPPAYGAKLVALILNDPALYSQWEKDLITMSSRINDMRLLLQKKLIDLSTPGNWDHIVSQQGMFSFTGLNPKQVERLEKVHSIYMTSNGRISIAGLNESNVDIVAKAFDEVVKYKESNL